LLVAWLFFGISAHADPVQAPNYFHHQVWSTEDGLPQASVHALLQSHEGYLWIATEGGVARFDGQSFVVFSHATVPAFVSDDMSCLAEDGSGDLWFGTSDGLVRKHGEEFRRFSSKDGLLSDQILGLAADSSDVLVLTTGGLAILKGGRFEPVAASDDITGLAETELGPVLVSRKGGVYRWDKEQLVSLSQSGLAILGAALGKNQTVWTYGSDFVQLSSPAQTKTWRNGVDLPGNRVQALYVDGQGTAWIGTNRGLVSVGAAPGSPVHEYGALGGESVLSVLVDREGDLWIGTEASGLHALQPRKFATVPGSTSEAVTTVARNSRGVMYFGTRDDGLFQDEGVAVSSNKLTSPVILSLAAGANGDVWAGTPDGLNQINDSEVRHWTIADGLPDNFVRSVVASSDGSAWAGTRFGLVHISRGSVQTFTRADGLPSDSIGPLLEVRGASDASVLWVGTSAGLCEKSGERFRCISSPYSSSGSIVTALAQDREGGLWVALHGHGLGLVLDDRIVPVQIAALPAEIVGILADNLGSLWLRSTRGLFRARASALRACAISSSACNNVRIETYGRSDGMQSDELAGEGIVPAAEGPNGQLWFATRRGIAVTDPQHLAADPVPPGVVITNAHVDGSELPLDKTAEISPGHRQYSFQFAGVSLNNATECRYMLDGFDPAWVDAGTRRTAYYTNLPPRQYVFRVLCANRDGLWSKDQASFQLRVLRPWYRSAWFYLLAACGVVLAIVGLVQLRVRAERRRFALLLQERTRVAREVHDTLAQDLVSVSLQVEMAGQHAKAGRLNDVAQQLTETRSLVRQALDSARQSIWNLRANLSQDSLPVRLAARVEAVRDTKVPARFRISGEYRSTAAGIENEVMRIASEAISNAERHSGATEIGVELSYGAESLKLQVQDNGCGFDYASARRKADHYGLRGLEERAALLKANVTVESIPGQGTTVTLIAPLSAERS
jgi:signal transduction histidine kinase/streptogramin lyase